METKGGLKRKNRKRSSSKKNHHMSAQRFYAVLVPIIMKTSDHFAMLYAFRYFYVEFLSNQTKLYSLRTCRN